MKRIRLTTTCVLAVFALLPAAAHALTTTWEVKGPPVGFAPLPVGTPETLNSTIAFTVTGGTGTAIEIKSACTGADNEKIENIATTAGTALGLDDMLAFEANCSANGPFPCVAGEAWNAKGAANASLPAWPSELEYMGVSVVDVFEKVELEIECVPSGAIAFYHPPGHVWYTKLGVNALKASKASGVFHNGLHWFYFAGTDHLKPVLHAEVR